MRIMIFVRQLFLLSDRFYRAGSGVGLAGDSGDSTRSIVYCREKSEREIWDDIVWGRSKTVAYLQVDEAHDGGILPMMPNCVAIRTPFCAVASQTSLDAQVQLNVTRAQVGAPAIQHDLYAILDEMRLRKDAG